MIRGIQKVLAYFVTDLALIFVLVGCLYFRTAVVMALFLAIYLIYFMLQFRKIAGLLK